MLPFPSASHLTQSFLMSYSLAVYEPFPKIQTKSTIHCDDIRQLLITWLLNHILSLFPPPPAVSSTIPKAAVCVIPASRFMHLKKPNKVWNMHFCSKEVPTHSTSEHSEIKPSLILACAKGTSCFQEVITIPYQQRPEKRPTESAVKC